MTTVVDRIHTIIDSNAAGFVRGTRQAETASMGLAASSTKSSKAAQMLGVEGAATGTLLKGALAAGAIYAGAKVVEFGKDSIDAFVGLADKVRDFQRVSGASAEESSRFVAVLDDMEIDATKGASAIFRLSKNVTDNADAFADHGIAVARNRDGSLNLTETLLNVADAYAASSDAGERNAIVTDTIGAKIGKNLIPVLEQGREGLKRFFDSAEDGHQILSQEDLQLAREYELALDALNDAATGFERQAGRALIPIVTEVTDGLTGGVSAVDSIAGALGGGAGDVAKFAYELTPLADALHGVSAVSKLVEGDVGGAAEQFARSIPVVGDIAGIFGIGEEEASGFAGQTERLKQAQADYANAIAESGPKSQEAAAARRTLHAAEAAVEGTQRQIVQGLQQEWQQRALVIQSVLAEEQARLAGQDTQAQAKQATDAYNLALASGVASSADLAAKQNDAQQAILAVALAAGNTAVAALGPLATEQERTKAASDAQVAALGFLAGTLDPGSPLRTYLQGLIDKIGEADKKKAKPEVHVKTDEARESIGVVNRALDELDNRTVSVRVKLDAGGDPFVAEVLGQRP